MPADRFQAAAWYRAMSLTERIAAGGPFSDLAGSAASQTDREALARGERRLQRWRAERHFAKGRAFADRLHGDGLTEAELGAMLGESSGRVQARFAATPSWLTALEEAFDGPAGALLAPWPDLAEGPTAGFLAAIRPLIDRARRRVQAGAREIVQTAPGAPFDPAIVDLVLFASLPRELLMTLGRTLVLEMHIARLEGSLDGETPEARLAAFQRRLCDRDAMVALLQAYPVLARQLVRRLDQWVTCSLEFLGHLAADWDLLRSTYARPGGHDATSEDMTVAAEPDWLTWVDGAQGDGHRGGRAVLLAHFASGLGVVYKPRSLAVEAHFQELLGWLNERGDHPPFRTITILDQGEYGWAELVEPVSCTTPDEVGRFYERQGAQLALLYAIEATDFHYENVLAAGEQPILLDLETLFHPGVVASWARPADELVDRTFRESILRVGLLGWRTGLNAESAGLDVSGLGATGGQVLPNAGRDWRGNGDELRIAAVTVELPPTRNRPTLLGADVDPLDFADRFERGFAEMYRLLIRHRAELLADDGPLARFANDPVRVIMRPTRDYMSLLRASTHPDVLRDALEQDRLFDRLWVRTDDRPAFARIVPLEQEELRNGDVPMFTTSPDSRDLWNGAGSRLSGLAAESGLEQTRRRIGLLGEADLTRQLGLIRAALATLARPGRMKAAPVETTRESGDLVGGRYEPVSSVTLEGMSSRGRQRTSGPTREEYLAEASAVGDRLLDLALHEDGVASWVGLSMPHADTWTVETLGADLYDGLPGLALFLAYLGEATGGERFRVAAESTLATLRTQLLDAPRSLRAIGAFTGLGGPIYAVTHLAVLWGRSDLLDEAERLVERLAGLIDEDDRLDLVGGAAGAIVTLLALYAERPSPAILAAAVRCGEHLLSTAQSVEGGLGWVGRIEVDARPAGLAHGVAGVAAALAELAAVCGDTRFEVAARAALAYERTLFDASVGNWRDLRTARPADSAPPTLWCYGAPGIGLARLRTLRFLDDPALHDEVTAAIRTTVAEGPAESQTLCHGTFGNLELLLQASVQLGDARCRSEADRLAGAVLDEVRSNGWRCATPLGVETPSLMIGLAGIGYGLLRLADPVGTPSVLTLEGPKTGR